MPNLAATIQLKKLEAKFTLLGLKEKLFFDKPLSLKALNSAIVAALEGFRASLESKLRGLIDFDLDDLSELKNFIKSDPELSVLFSKANSELDNETLSSLLLQCEILNDSTITDEILKQRALDELQNVNFLGDGLDKLAEFLGDLSNKLAALGDALTPYIGIALFLFYIIKLAIDLLTNTEFPSPYRTKYIQKLIRMALAMMKDIVNEQIGILKAMFDGIDELLITMAVAAALYLYNRVKFQNLSTEQLAENLCEDLGLNPFEDIIVDISTGPINLTELPLACPVNNDTVIVPKEPIENKIENFSCEIPTEDEVQIEAIIKEDLATKAIILNETENPFKFEVVVDTVVTDRTILATLEGLPVYSPINGKVVSLMDSSIVLSDISESSESFLTQTIQELNAAYQEQNEIKMFVKDWQVKSLYPVMMSRSAEVDSSANIDPITITEKGMLKKFDRTKKQWENILESYNKNIKDITGESNVKKNAENETLHIVKEEVEAEESVVNKYLRRIEDQAIAIARITKPKKSDYELIDYFVVELATDLNAIKDPSGLTLEYRDHINEFTDQRYVIDGYKPEKIRDKGNEYLDELEKGITLGDWFQKGLDKYNENKKLSDVKYWLENIDNPKKLESYEKEQLIAKLMYLFEFYLDIATKNEEYKDLKEADDKEQVTREGNYISNFFGQLWIRFDALPDEIAELEQRLESLALFTGYSITEIQGEEYRTYLISDKEGCKRPDRDPNLGGATETDLGSIKYWLKYCSFATLASVVNPVFGWSTGWLGPPGPIPFPTIYIPIKPISTSYGFIVLGLSITGIWIFPFVLMVNYSTDYNLPIFDPVAFLKKQIGALKAELGEALGKLKGEAFENYLNNISANINDLQPDIDGIEEQIKIHRTERPPKTRAFENAQVEWNTENVKLKEKRTELKLTKWAEEKKFKIVYEAKELGTPVAGGAGKAGDAALKKLEDSEKLITDQFNKLDLLVEKLNLTIAPLPITLQPNTANFGFTLKNPKPIINMADEISDNINETNLENIMKPFNLNNEKMMTKGGLDAYNYKGMLTAVDLMKFVPGAAPIKKDPFPAYENLALTNFQWLSFLYKDWVPTGAQTYGFPGQMPTPIG